MISIVLGTRPEIIKMSPIIRECERHHIPYFILHTGQHYSYDMDRIFFDELELPIAKYHLDVGSGTHAEQTGKIMSGVENILDKEHPNIVLVQGDTNTAMASALAAVKLHIPVGHVEAGLRSFDRNMPEEINRIVADHISDYLFAPTETAKKNLLREGIPDQKIFLTGNTIVDAVHQNQKIAKKTANILHEKGLTPGDYCLATAHRAENVDVRERLEGIILGLQLIHEQYTIPVIIPLHPRTEKMVHDCHLRTDGITVIPPVGYLDFLELEANAKVIFTDSGGVQEESCILHVPCVTLRDTTERPETITVGSNMLVGTETKRIVQGFKGMSQKKRGWKNPFGDGKSGEKIVRICMNMNKGID